MMSSLMDAGMAEVAKYTLAGVLILMIVSQPSHISVSQSVTVCLSVSQCVTVCHSAS